MVRDIIRINDVSLDDEEINSVVEVLKSGILTDKSGMGPRVIEFEHKFAEYIGIKHAVAVSNGTSALHAALLAANIGPRDEVILPSFTFSATAEAVLLTGAKPVFADIDEETYTITLESIENVISRQTRAIIPVDLYGLPADLTPILELSEKRDITVIEDAAQSVGASYNENLVGGIAHLTCFSFYASKNITTGEGGMVTTSDDDLADALRMIRVHGESKPYWVEMVGHNYRMTEIQAAIGTVQLNKLPTLLEKRRKNASQLTEKLEKIKKLILPFEPEGRRHAWHLYTIRVKGVNGAQRNKIVDSLRAKKISASVYYQSPVHLLPYYKRTFGFKKGMLPNTEKAANQVISLPVHPNLSPEDIESISMNLRKSLTK